MTHLISPAYALAHVAPNWFDTLSDVELLAAAFDFDMWLRPEQRVPRTPFDSYGVLAGRGWGKTFGIAVEINRRVEANELHSLALMAPNDDRVDEVQASILVALSPPWFKAEKYAGGVRWPNGVVTEVFTPLAPGRSRSGNFELCWLTEIVDWQATTRWEAYCNITTATRVGAAQVFWDSTSKGKNEVIQHLLRERDADPERNIVQRGVIFDNPLLTREYIRKEVRKYVKGSRRYREEMLGEVFAESAGALWHQQWLDDNRLTDTPRNLEIVIVVIDPSQSGGPDADEAGMCVAGRYDGSHIAVMRDLSARMAPETWAKAAVARCKLDAAGVVYERNNAGDMPRDLIKVHAEREGMRVEVLTNDKQPFPRRTPGVVYVRSVVSRDSKECRAEAPAALYQEGRVHHVGVHDLLELEQTTWEPGGKSPNRLDACVWAVTELADLSRQAKPKATEGDIAAVADMQRQLLASLRGGGRRL
jgi:phage terminase large subunit-like protein